MLDRGIRKGDVRDKPEYDIKKNKPEQDYKEKQA